MVKARPVASTAKLAGAPAEVVPRMTVKKKNVRTVSITAQERRL